MTTDRATRFRHRRSPLDGVSTHPMLDASQPARITVVHATQPATAPGVSVLPLGPVRHLVVFETEAVASDPVDPTVDVSHGFVRIRVAGEDAASVLASGISLDLRAAAFPVGTAAPTAFRDIFVVLHAREPGEYDIYTARSTARCLWEWLVDAADGVTGVTAR